MSGNSSVSARLAKASEPEAQTAQATASVGGFAQLVDWYNYLLVHTSVWTTAGIVAGDKDESTNRIHFGIQTRAGRDELKKKLLAADVPCDLILLDSKVRSGFSGMPGAAAI